MCFPHTLQVQRCLLADARKRLEAFFRWRPVHSFYDNAEGGAAATDRLGKRSTLTVFTVLIVLRSRQALKYRLEGTKEGLTSWGYNLRRVTVDYRHQLTHTKKSSSATMYWKFNSRNVCLSFLQRIDAAWQVSRSWIHSQHRWGDWWGLIFTLACWQWVKPTSVAGEDGYPKSRMDRFW